MNDFSEMLRRVNLQTIGLFLQTGGQLEDKKSDNLEKREDAAVRLLEQQLKETLPEDVLGKVTDIAMEYANACCEIYFTVGMKSGAKLVFQLLNDSLQDG